MPTFIPSIIYLFPLNTQIIEIDGLKDVVSGTFLDSATATATLYNNQGQADSILNNITMNYIAASNGQYQGTVPDTFNAPLGSGYTLVITAVQAGVQAQWTIPVQVKARNQ